MKEEPVTISRVFMTLEQEAVLALAKMLGNDNCCCVEDNCDPGQCTTCKELNPEDVPPVEVTIPAPRTRR